MDTELINTACNSSVGNFTNCLSSNDTLDGMEEERTELYVVLPMLIIFSIVGSIGNATSFYIYFKRRDKSTSVIFILALAGTDFLTCLFIIPFTSIFELMDYYLYFDFLCKLYLFLITSNIPFSAFIMTAIAFDRYFCICHPFLHAINVKRAKILVVCLAMLSFTLGLITCLSYGTYNIDEAILSDNYQLWNDSHNLLNETELYPTHTNFTEDGYAIVTEKIVFYGTCANNHILISEDFLNVYQKVYAGSFLVSFVAVVILYCMIYHSILARRAKKAKRKRKNYYTSVAVTEPEANTMNALNSTANNGTLSQTVIEKGTHKPVDKRPSNVKDTTLYANIKTAMMLFVVTIVFTVAFLPSWLMAHGLLPFNMIVFYMYFSYNVANPIIYAFMNQTFREDLKNILKVCK